MTTRPTIVLVPGLLCDQDIWRDQAEALGRRYDVILPGFMDETSIERMAGTILDQAPERFSLAGHSMGGRVALEIVARAPGRVARLALLDTGFHPAKTGEADRRKVLIETARNQGMTELARLWLPPMLAPGRDRHPALMARLTAMVARADPDIFQRQTTALLARPNAHKGLSAIACPTAVIVGKQDAWSPLAQHEEMVACIPNAYLTVLDACGHMSPVEQPEGVTAALMQWMQAELSARPLAQVS